MNPSDNPPHGESLVPIRELAALYRQRYGVPALIYDVGACDASNAIAWRGEFPIAQVVAIEGLVENVDRWLTPHPDVLTAVHAVIGAEEGVATFYVKNENGLHSLYDRGGEFGNETRRVAVHRLDGIASDLGHDRIDILCIDCEGAASDVLIGAGKLLDSVRLIAVELEDGEFFKGQALRPVVDKLLGERGFMCVIDRHWTAPNGWRQYETAWIRK